MMRHRKRKVGKRAGAAWPGLLRGGGGEHRALHVYSAEGSEGGLE
jgi:hypothetical protein